MVRLSYRKCKALIKELRALRSEHILAKNPNDISPCEAVGWKRKALRMEKERNWWKKLVKAEIANHYVSDKPVKRQMASHERRLKKELGDQP